MGQHKQVIILYVTWWCTDGSFSDVCETTWHQNPSFVPFCQRLNAWYTRQASSANWRSGPRTFFHGYSVELYPILPSSLGNCWHPWARCDLTVRVITLKVDTSTQWNTHTTQPAGVFQGPHNLTKRTDHMRQLYVEGVYNTMLEWTEKLPDTNDYIYPKNGVQGWFGSATEKSTWSYTVHAANYKWPEYRTGQSGTTKEVRLWRSVAPFDRKPSLTRMINMKWLTFRQLAIRTLRKLYLARDGHGFTTNLTFTKYHSSLVKGKH